jgi:uncharacterized damage-inducible protein DinB
MSETPLTPNEADLLRHHFSERFRHDWWANDTLLTFLEQQPGVRRTAAYEAGLQEACHLFGHLLATELLWLGRVESSEDVAVPVWGTREPSKLRALLGQARSKWKALLDSLAPSDCWRVVTYRNTTGQTYENTLIQIIASLDPPPGTGSRRAPRSRAGTTGFGLHCVSQAPTGNHRVWTTLCISGSHGQIDSPRWA